MKTWKKVVLWVFAIVVLALAAAFIFIGVFRGEPGLILQKAIRICLECIGIG